MMNIAWTSLFHAIFEKKGIKYFYRQENSSRYVYLDDQRKAWDLSKCINEYFGGNDVPEMQNLKFFIGLRNQIEHRFLPALDLEICGECQSLLLNYEKMLTQEFGDIFSLNESLAIPLQLLTVNPAWRNQIFKELQSREYSAVKEYIDTFRYSLTENILNRPEYSFRVFLVPKLGNKETSSDVAIEFVPYDPNKPEEMAKYKKMVAFIKEKQVPVVNLGKLKPLDVAKRIEKKLNIKFHPSSHHAMCWRYFKVRPSADSDTPEKTNTRYCQYDVAHRDYVYTEEWAQFLISELSDPVKRKSVLNY